MNIFRKKTAPTLSAAITKLFADNTELETERLVLRKITPEHTSDMFMYSQDADVTRFLTWSPHSSEKETARYIKLLAKKYESGAFWDFGLIEKQSGRMIGTCGFTSCDDKENSVEIGYVLAKDLWGKGLATEAASFLAGFAFGELGVSKVIAKMIDGNNGSMNVMKKLGMKLEGTFKNSMFIKGEYKTIHVFGVTKENFAFPIPEKTGV